MTTREKWADLEVKTRIAYITAIVAFVAGWGLTIAGFVVGHGEVHDSVLWILGQSLLYTGSIFGVGMYVNNSVRGMKEQISRFMRNEDRRYRGLPVEEDDDTIDDTIDDTERDD